MKILFLTNYFSHHQLALGDALHRLTGGNFLLGETGEMEVDRRGLGWDATPRPLWARPVTAGEIPGLIDRCDALILGAAPARWCRVALKWGKVVLRWSERPLKNGFEPLKYPFRLVRWRYRWPRHPKLWLLAAGAGAAEDYRRFGLFRGQAVKWGYFPPPGSAARREKDPALVLWAGRLLELKHPEYALRAAARLRGEGILFRMELMGCGPLEEHLRASVRGLGLEPWVTLTGAARPEDVRRRMEEAGIFLFTSDRREGWGAVLWEAMEGGCALAAHDGAGSVLFLLRHGENGLICPSGDEEGLYQNLRELLLDPARQRELGDEARRMAELWSGERAAAALTELIRALMEGRSPDLPEQGPCSPAGGTEWIC